MHNGKRILRMLAKGSVEQATFLIKLAMTPEDETLRMVYADWLDEHDQPKLAADQRARARGHRALVLLGRAPRFSATRPGGSSGPKKYAGLLRCFEWWPGERFNNRDDRYSFDSSEMPKIWYDKIVADAEYRNGASPGGIVSKDFTSKARAMAAAARAFGLLTEKQQERLLKKAKKWNPPK